MIDLATQFASVAAHPAQAHAYMTVEGGVRAIDLGDARGPAYAFKDDIGFEGVIAPGGVDHQPVPGETLRMSGGWSLDPEDMSTTFLSVQAETIH